MKKIRPEDVHTPDWPVDEMPNLSARLGKARADRIRYVGLADPSRLYHSKNIPNTIRSFMQDKQPGDLGCWVDDIVQGIARLDHQATKHASPPLSVSRLYNILQCIEMINTREVMAMLQVEKRQAQKYVKAAQLVITFVEQHRKKDA